MIDGGTVLRYLRDHPGTHAAADIAAALDTPVMSVVRHLQELHREARVNRRRGFDKGRRVVRWWARKPEM